MSSLFSFCCSSNCIFILSIILKRLSIGPVINKSMYSLHCNNNTALVPLVVSRHSFTLGYGVSNNKTTASQTQTFVQNQDECLCLICLRTVALCSPLFFASVAYSKLQVLQQFSGANLMLKHGLKQHLKHFYIF